MTDALIPKEGFDKIIAACNEVVKELADEYVQADWDKEKRTFFIVEVAGTLIMVACMNICACHGLDQKAAFDMHTAMTDMIARRVVGDQFIAEN